MNAKQGVWCVGLQMMVAVALGLGGAPMAVAFTITASQDVGAGAALSGAGAETITCAGGTGAATNPYVYAWSGSPSADLALGASRLFTTNGKSFMLDLLKDAVKGSVTGAQSNSVTALSTATSDGSVPGSVILTNVGDVTVGKIDTSRSAGNIDVAATNGSIVIGSSGNRAGTVRIAGMTTIPVAGANTTWKAGGVSIYATGSVLIADADGTRRDIDAHGQNTRGAGGAVTINHEGGDFVAGRIRTYSRYGEEDLAQSGGAVVLAGGGALAIARIETFSAGGVDSAGNGGNVTISGYVGTVTITGAVDTSAGVFAGSGSGTMGAMTKAGDVTIGSASNRAGGITIGGITTQCRDNWTGIGVIAGSVSLYSTGSIRIVDSGFVRKSVLANAIGPGRHGAGAITIDHLAGDFQADLLDTSAAGVYPDADTNRLARPIVADGHGGGGSFQVNGINSYYTHSTANMTVAGKGGPVTIRNYGSVTISSNVNASTSDTHASAKGGDLAITNIAGDIAIGGTVNLAKTSNATSNGVLRLQCGGSILLGTLDLAKVKSATLHSGAGQSAITNQLLNFPTNNPASGLLDAVTNQTIVYDGRVASNAYLLAVANGMYTLKSGGVLKARVAAGTMLVVW